MTAEEYYKKGNEHRQRGEWGKAMSCYLEAIDLDPDSPALHAKESTVYACGRQALSESAVRLTEGLL